MISGFRGTVIRDRQAQRVAASIVDVVKPELIVCFGARVTAYDAWSCFDSIPRKSTTISWDLVVIISETESRSNHAILEIAENAMLSRGMSATILVHRMAAVRDALVAGSPFFCKLFCRGIRLYDRSGRSMGLCRLPGNTRMRPGSDAWRRSYCLARQFFAGALYFQMMSWNNITAFMLHQSIEHLCVALILRVTGYRFSSHNLKRLVAMTENFSTHFAAEFPCTTDEERNLFLALGRSYSDARYKNEFEIPPALVSVLIERVKRFHSRAGSLLQ